MNFRFRVAITMFWRFVISVLAAQTLLAVHAYGSRSTIVLFSRHTNYTGFVLKESRIMFLVSTFKNRWGLSVKQCGNMDGRILQMTDVNTMQYLDGVPEIRINRSVTYFVDGIERYGKNWTFSNGTEMVINRALWHTVEPNGPGNKQWHVCAGLIAGRLGDYYCRKNFSFICQKQILPFLRLTQEKGNIELQYDNVWSPLCFDLGLSTAETGRICQDQYNLLYKTFSNTYTYPNFDNDTDESWYDNANLKCKFTQLHCKGEEPGTPVIAYNKNAVFMGNTLTLSCTVFGGIPKPTIGWNRQGRNLQTMKTWKLHNNKIMFSGSTSLTLSSDDNNVLFSCIVNYKGNDSYYNRGVTLNVLYPPIMTVQNYVEVNETDDVILDCHVTSNPPSNVKWKLPTKNETSIGATLTIANVYRTALGSYTCQAENVYRSQKYTEKNTTLLYINAPPKMCLYQHEFTAGNGSIEMKCSATGVPTPKITWYRDSELITNTTSTKHISVSTVAPDNPYLVLNKLTVSGIGDEDLVGYRCSVTNHNGVLNKTFRIHRKLKCRCLSRLLKNCIPLEFKPEALAATVIETKEKLTVKKDELTSNKIKLISSDDKRSSSSAIGLLGVGILVTISVVFIVFDLIGYFVIKPHLKNNSKIKQRERANFRSNIEVSLLSNRSRCQTDGDIQLTDIIDSDQELTSSDQHDQHSTVSSNYTVTTAEVHIDPQ